MKVSEKLHKAINGKCPKIKPGTLERVKLKTEVLLKDHLTVIKKPKIEAIEDTEETELEDDAEEEAVTGVCTTCGTFSGCNLRQPRQYWLVTLFTRPH